MKHLERGGSALILLLLLLSGGTVYYSRLSLQQFRTAEAVRTERPPLYLPDVHYVKLVTLGYNTTASKLLWFSTINYFGRQFANKGDYRWLGNMCRLVTSLDSRPTHSFEFCATLLSWMAKEPQKSVDLLSSAIASHPDYWRFRYLRGFNYWYFLNRLDLARSDFIQAAQIPDAPAFLASVASRMLASAEGPTLARQFLEEMIKNTEDPKVLQILQKRLNGAILSEGRLAIESAVQKFFEEKHRLPLDCDELLRAGLLKELPPEPYGGKFYVDQQSGRVKTTSNQWSLGFSGRNASNGLYSQETPGESHE